MTPYGLDTYCVRVVYFAIIGQFISGYFLFTVCFTIPGTFMTVLCLFNNISRHIKDSVWNFEFVTEIRNNFLDLKIMFFVL